MLSGATSKRPKLWVNIVKNILIIFLISGFLYGLAGYLEAARVGLQLPNTSLNYDLDAISASVIGGTLSLCGIGTPSPGVIGAIIRSSTMAWLM